MKNYFLFAIALLAISYGTLAQNVEISLPDNWKAKRATDLTVDGSIISGSEYKPEGWIDALVPGTILTTLLHNHIIPDPFFGMNNNLIPDVYATGRDYYTYWFYND